MGPRAEQNVAGWAKGAGAGIIKPGMSCPVLDAIRSLLRPAMTSPALRENHARATEFSLFLQVDVAVFADVFEADRDVLRDAGLLHGDAVERVGAGHRLFRMGDDDKLGEGEEVAQHADEAADVGLVERGVDLVEDAERAGLAAKDRQQAGRRR